MELRAGCASFPITPLIPGVMGGYVAREGPSRGVHDYLWARAIAFESEGTRLGIVVGDLLAVPRDLAEAVRRAAGDVDPPFDHVVVAATHTHSGPGIPPFPSEGDPVYLGWLPRAMAGALAMAERDLEPVTVGWGAARAEGLGANRRDPAIPSDPEVACLCLWRTDGSLKGTMLGHACHPTVLGPANQLISADFPGAGLAIMGTALGPGVWTCYAQGAAGDVSCRFTRRGQTFDEVRRLGTILAGAGLLATARAEPAAGLPLAAGVRSVVLPMRDLPPAEVSVGRLEEARAKVAELEQAGAGAGAIRLAQSVVEGSVAEANLAGEWDRLEHEAELTAVRLGDAAILAVPGELFGSVGRAIRDRSPFAITLLVGYADGYIGYVPDREAYESGGYEALVTWLDPGAGEVLVDEAAKLLSDLHREAG